MNKLFLKNLFLLLPVYLLIILCSQMVEGAPNLKVTSSVTDVNAGLLVLNDVVEYSFTVTNTSSDSATSVILTDTIPANTTYVANSLVIDSVSKTDVSLGVLGDEADYNTTTKVVTMRLGTLATGISGGALASNASTTVKFQVKVATGTVGTVITNKATVNYNDLLGLNSYTSYSDSNPNATGSQDSIIIVNSNPPSIQLVHSILPTGNQPPKTNLTFTSVFTNSGGSQAQNFVIIEPIPGNTNYKLSSTAVNLGTTGLTLLSTEYSNDNGATYAYTPVSGGGGAASGYDANVNYVRFVFVGLLSNSSPNNTGNVSFTTQIK